MGSILVADAAGRTSRFKAKLKKKKDTLIKSIRKGRLLNIHENSYLSLIKLRRNLLLVHKIFDRNEKSLFLFKINLSSQRYLRAGSSNIHRYEISNYSEQISVANRPLLSNSSVKPNFNGSAKRCV